MIDANAFVGIEAGPAVLPQAGFDRMDFKSNFNIRPPVAAQNLEFVFAL